MNRLTTFVALGTLLMPSFQATLASQEPEHRSPPKRFEWVDSRSGNCHMSGVLTLHSNGKAMWSATTWTDQTHNKDIWHETVRILNSDGKELFGFGVWDSPPMDSPPNGGQYHWSKEGQFPAAFFDAADSATSAGDC